MSWEKAIADDVLRTAVCDALTNEDPGLASLAADRMRFRHGLTYQQSFRLVQEFMPGTTLAEWDVLLMEGES